MRTSLSQALVTIIGLFSLSLPAAELPETVIPAGVGVNIHFTTGHEADLEKIAEGGFKFIRMDFGWGGIERKKGEYDWSAYDQLTDNLAKRGIRPYYIFDYSNGLYEETITAKNPVTGHDQRDVASPQHPESVAAFARWAAAAAKHFQGRHVIWEIFNEPNIEFWKPHPDADQYATLALATLKAVRAADPQATIVAPGSSTFPWPFIETLFAAGALNYLDAVSVHPYRGSAPETAAEDYLKLRGLIARYAPPGKKNLPVISGEWGYSSNTKGVSLEKQAAYLARQQLANLWADVPVSIWYDWKNDGPDPKENEHNFGTMTQDLQPKPSYEAIHTLTHQLIGYRLARRLETSHEEDYALLCLNQTGDQKIAVWTTSAAHAITLDLGATGNNEITAAGLRGEPVKVQEQNGVLTVEAGAGPVYLTLAKPVESFMAAAAWRVHLTDGVLIQAGAGKNAHVDVRMMNPFARIVRAKLHWETSSGDQGKDKEYRFKEREGAQNEFAFPATRRDVAAGNILVRVEFYEDDGIRLIGRSSERVAFLLANPFAVTLAPIETGTRLEIQNPTGGEFAGQVKLAGTQQKVGFNAGQTKLMLDLPGAIFAAAGGLYDGKGNLVAELKPGNVRPVKIENFRAALDGDAKVEAKARITVAAAPAEGAPFTKAFKLDYEFAEGWRFVRCIAEAVKPVAIEGRPKALGVWIYGTNSGHSVHLRVMDATGQTFQHHGARIDWTGWRWVTIPLDNAAASGHWGGADDGVVHGELHWDCPLLFDGTRAKASSTVYFAGLVLIYP